MEATSADIDASSSSSSSSSGTPTYTQDPLEGDGTLDLSLLELFQSTPPLVVTASDTEVSLSTSQETDALELLLLDDELDDDLSHDLDLSAFAAFTASSSSSSSPSPPSSPPIATPQPPAAPKLRAIRPLATAALPVPLARAAPPCRLRRRAKDELESLRQHVADLEEQLRRLQVRREENAGGDRGRPTEFGSVAQLTTTSAQLWKRVATRQLDARRTAEAENTRLRGVLEAQLKLARKLARLLRKHPNFLDATPPRPTSLSSCRHFFSDTSTNSSIYTGLAERLGPLYSSMDGVLAEAGFAAEKREICSAYVKSDATGSHLYLELVGSIILPFDLQAVTAAFWQLFGSSSMEIDGGVYEGLGSGGNSTLRSRFSVNYQLQHGESEFHGHLLGRQVLEDTRAVLVWNTAGECEGSLFGHERMYVQEMGWLAIEEVAQSTVSSEASPMTIVQTVLRVHPRIVGGDGEVSGSAPLIHVRTLADAVAGALPQNLEKLHRMTEDIILGVDSAQGGGVLHGVCNSVQQYPS